MKTSREGKVYAISSDMIKEDTLLPLPPIKFCSIICSFNSPELTGRVYEQLKKNKKHDIFVLENSTTKGEMFKSKDTIDMGRKNVGFGGMGDYVLQNFKEYDFVGILNSDIFDIPTNYIETLEKHFKKENGMVSSAIQKNGTGWEQMAQIRSSGAREVYHIETIATYFNTELFDKLCEFIPSDYYGCPDIVYSGLYKKYGYKNIVVDDVVIGHMLAGSREAAGVKQEYLNNVGRVINEWLDKNPEIHKIYNDYIKSISKEIAVIIPNYNHNHLIRRAVESVVAQDVDVDIIVIDDYSDKEPLEELKDLPVRYFRHDRNRGLAAARNTGIANTKAKWILPLDADDELLPGALRALKDFAEEQEIDVAYGNLIWTNNSRLKPIEEFTKDMFLSNNQLLGSSLYKREIWVDIDGYWEEPKEFYEDWDFWGRAAFAGYKFKYLDKDIYNYAGGPEGMCARLGEKRDDNVKIVTDHIKEFIKSRE